MQDESFNGMYQVRQGGYILIPQVGRVPVSGMTVPAAEESVAKAFSQTMIVNPTVIIERPEAANQEEDSGGVIYLMEILNDLVHFECKEVVQLPFLTPLFSLVVRLLVRICPVLGLCA